MRLNTNRSSNRNTPLLSVVLLVLVSLIAAACSSSNEISTEAPPDSEQPAVDSNSTPEPSDGVPRCEDIEPLESTISGSLGSRSNPDDLLMGVIFTYAQENLDTYAGRWIDRENGGTIVVAFTDDPESHRAELLARGPKETDEVGIEPPPPITDPRTLGERDDFVFEVIQATHSEADLMAAQDRMAALITNPAAGSTGSAIDTIKNVVSLQFIDPTPEALSSIADIVAGDPVCLDIFISPKPPDGPLAIVAAPGEPVVHPDGLGEVRWELDPSFPTLGPGDTEVHVLATERGCASGRDMGSALRGPEVVETDTEVAIAFAVEIDFGGQDCQGNPATPITITLAQPLGDRALRDGGSLEPPAVVDEPTGPVVDQPAGGDGWRMIASTGVIDAWNGPVAATSLEEFWVLVDTFWEMDLSAEGVDFDNEIVIAQLIVNQLGNDEQCGPHVMDNVRIVDEAFTYDIASPLHTAGGTCADPDGYQVFVVALERAQLPNVIRLPNRASLIEVQIR